MIAAAGFLFSGVMKFVGPAEIVTLYDQIGIGQCFRHLTGILEVVGALAVLVAPAGRARRGAARRGDGRLGGSAVAALAFLAVSLVIAWGWRDKALGLT